MIVRGTEEQLQQFKRSGILSRVGKKSGMGSVEKCPCCKTPNSLILMIKLGGGTFTAYCNEFERCGISFKNERMGE